MTEPVGDPVVDPPVDPTHTPEDPPSADRSFTTADVERIVKERLARAKTTPPDDYEEAKAAMARLAEIEEANKTEIEKERDRAAKAEERASKVEAESQKIKLRSAILSEAAKPDRRVVDPDLVATLLGPDIELDKDGNPTNVAKAMDSLLEARPYLVASSGGTRGSADQGARNGAPNQVSEAALDDMTAEQIVAARKAGRLTGLGVAP